MIIKKNDVFNFFVITLLQEIVTTITMIQV
jgi:hypothetical protein